MILQAKQATYEQEQGVKADKKCLKVVPHTMLKHWALLAGAGAGAGAAPPRLHITRLPANAHTSLLKPLSFLLRRCILEILNQVSLCTSPLVH